MKLIVGLGNPGEKYANNRHNAGFVVVEGVRGSLSCSSSFKLQEKFFGEICREGELLLLMPATFMNESGKAVAAVANFYKIKHEDIYVVYDDLDIALGQYKIQYDRGPKVHNGLSSVRSSLGSNSFWHVRVGVENREIKGNSGIAGVEYSLQNFAPNERKIFEETVKKIIEEITLKVRPCGLSHEI